MDVVYNIMYDVRSIYYRTFLIIYTKIKSEKLDTFYIIMILSIFFRLHINSNNFGIFIINDIRIIKQILLF